MAKTYNFRKKIIAVVPCKNLEFSNGRLRGALSTAERQQLACVMLEDVLTGLFNSPELGGVLVVSDDKVVKRIATDFGATCLENYNDRGLSSALTEANQLLDEEGAKGVIAVHADLPYLTGDDFKPVLRSLRIGPSVAIVPAARDKGTNILAMSPPGVIGYAYGKLSSLRHAAEAREKGIEPSLLQIPRLSFDLDTPEDLIRFITIPSNTNTYRYLVKSGVEARMLEPKINKSQIQAVG